jgi:hypothetical protein
VTVMATLSVRDVATRHLGKTGDVSIDADVYGYIHRDLESRLFGALDVGDVLPGSGTADAPTRRSLRRHLETVSGRSVDFVVFLVGHEPDFSGVVTRSQVAKLQYALQVARDLYAQVDLGIRRVEWGHIPPSLAGNYADIGSVVEAVALTAVFTGRAGAIDLFFVQTMNVLVGRSPSPGGCDKNDLIAFTGIVLEATGTAQFAGITVAREAGHYLGLGHEPDETNLMCGPQLFQERCDPSTRMTEITSDQGARMKTHCMVNAGDA